MSETDKNSMDPEQIDVFALLTMSIDADMERYLRHQGLSWFFKRRQRFQAYLKRRGIDAR